MLTKNRLLQTTDSSSYGEYSQEEVENLVKTIKSILDRIVSSTEILRYLKISYYQTSGSLDDSPEVIIDNHKAKEEFLENLQNSFEMTPFEYGVCHQAEDIINKALEEYPFLTPGWIKDLFTKDMNLSHIPMSDLLACLSRLNYEKTKSFIHTIIFECLKNSAIDLRLAAIKAINMIGSSEFLNMLQYYIDKVEKDEWLKNLARRALKYLNR